MKKPLFLTIFMAMVTFWASAQSPDGIFVSFGASTDSSITINGRSYSGTDFFVRGEYRLADSTGPFNFGPLVYESPLVSNFPYVLDSLAAQTSYQIMLVFYNDSMTDSLVVTAGIDSTTTAPTLPVQATVGNARLVPGFPMGMVIFNDTSIGYQDTADLQFASGQYAPTPYWKIIGPGIHTDTIYFPTTANDTISIGYVLLTPTGHVPGVHVVRSNFWSPGVCPGYKTPVLHLAANPFHDKDSLSISVVIDSLGDAGYPNLATRLNTSSGTLVASTSPHQINTVGTINFPFRNLKPDSTYVFTTTLTDVVGADTAKVSIQLDPMDLPTVVLDTPAPTSTVHTYQATALVDPVDTYALAKIAKVYLEEFGIIVDSVIPVNNVAVFNEINRTANTNYVDKFIVKNVGGHTGVSSPFSIATKPAVAPRTEHVPVVSNLRSGPSSTMVDISYTVTPGDTLLDLWGYSQTQGTSIVDSQIVGHMLTQSGTIYGFTFINQTAETGYCYSAMSYTADSIAEYGSDSCQITSGGSDPMLFGITQTTPVLTNGIKAVIHGSGGGNWSAVTYWLTNYSSGAIIGLVDTANVGTGEVTKPVSWTNLPANQQYCINAYISLVDGNRQSPTLTECFWTGTTGIQLTTNGSTDQIFVAISNTLGQRVAEHIKFGDARHELPKGQVFMVQPYNEDGTLGEAQKFVF